MTDAMTDAITTSIRSIFGRDLDGPPLIDGTTLLARFKKSWTISLALKGGSIHAAAAHMHRKQELLLGFPTRLDPNVPSDIEGWLHLVKTRRNAYLRGGCALMKSRMVRVTSASGAPHAPYKEGDHIRAIQRGEEIAFKRAEPGAPWDIFTVDEGKALMRGLQVTPCE